MFSTFSLSSEKVYHLCFSSLSLTLSLMGDYDRSGAYTTVNLYSILGIPKSASLTEICKAYKSLVKKWHPDRNSTNRAEAQAKFTSINEAYRVLSTKKREEDDNTNQDEPKTLEGNYNSGQNEKLIISKPRSLSTSTTQDRLSPLLQQEFQAFMPTPTASTPKESSIGLTKITSKRSTTPIIFSQSKARRRPQPIEKKLECTLEELCHGSVKKMKITRDVISNEGLIVQEQEILKITIKPGWKRGTKVTFEGKGDEKPGMHPADIIFVIDEKRHPIFKREGDDLELGVEIPLVQALTGCEISVPLLGGEKSALSLDEIIFPGYEKIIPGQGMTKPKLEGMRGNLRLRFLVEFPDELSDEKRSQLVHILGDCS